MNDLINQGATAIARAIAAGDASAIEVTEAFIARLEASDARLHAITARRYDAARREARAVDARRSRGEALPALAGVPITVKDSIDVAGLASSFGLPWRRDLLADADDAHIARLRAHGAIPLAKSNVAQLLIYVESDNPLHGRTLHPERADRSPGGSSGGEGALIGAGASVLGVGTDIGGSIRLPAHFCGITGFKPTAGRCDDPGRYSVPQGQLAIRSQLGPLARRVADLTLALRHMQAGPELGVPALPDPAGVDLSRLRIGWCDDDGAFPAAPALRRAVREAARALADAGAQVVPFKTLPWAELFGLAFQVMTGDGGKGMRAELRGAKAHPSAGTLLMLAGLPAWPRSVLKTLLGAFGQPMMAGFLDQLGFTSTHAHWQRVAALLDLRRRSEALLDRAEGGPIDVLLAPPCSLPAFTHGASRDLGVAGAYTIAMNALGWPAGVVPWTRVGAGEESDRPATRDRVFSLARSVEQGSAGLPVGVQVISRPWRDHQALAVMGALEALQPAPGA